MLAKIVAYNAKYKYSYSTLYAKVMVTQILWDEDL